MRDQNHFYQVSLDDERATLGDVGFGSVQTTDGQEGAVETRNRLQLWCGEAEERCEKIAKKICCPLTTVLAEFDRCLMSCPPKVILLCAAGAGVVFVVFLTGFVVSYIFYTHHIDEQS